MNQVLAHLENFLVSEGFTKVQHNGEIVFKKGMGVLTAPQFIKMEIHGEQIQLQAWIKYALLPGVYIGEMGVTGFFAWLPKKKLKDRVDAIEAFIHQDNAANPAQQA